MCVVTVDCCTGSLCWCFTSNGLNTVSQDEIVFVLRCEQEENRIPRDVFYLFKMLYQHAAAGEICSPSVDSYSKNTYYITYMASIHPQPPPPIKLLTSMKGFPSPCFQIKGSCGKPSSWIFFTLLSFLVYPKNLKFFSRVFGWMFAIACSYHSWMWNLLKENLTYKLPISPTFQDPKVMQHNAPYLYNNNINESCLSMILRAQLWNIEEWPW